MPPADSIAPEPASDAPAHETWPKADDKSSAPASQSDELSLGEVANHAAAGGGPVARTAQREAPAAESDLPGGEAQPLGITVPVPQ
jgi:hypothetical protein